MKNYDWGVSSLTTLYNLGYEASRYPPWQKVLLRVHGRPAHHAATVARVLIGCCELHTSTCTLGNSYGYIYSILYSYMMYVQTMYTDLINVGKHRPKCWHFLPGSHTLYIPPPYAGFSNARSQNTSNLSFHAKVLRPFDLLNDILGIHSRSSFLYCLQKVLHGQDWLGNLLGVDLHPIHLSSAFISR